MAKCDEGYICCVCGNDVEDVTQSDLYLRYVVGLVDPELLHTTPEKHIRCNPSIAQYIVAEDFPAVAVDGPFAKSGLDPEFVRDQEQLFTRGWRRLQEIRNLGDISILEFPLPEVADRFRNPS